MGILANHINAAIARLDDLETRPLEQAELHLDIARTILDVQKQRSNRAHSDAILNITQYVKDYLQASEERSRRYDEEHPPESLTYDPGLVMCPHCQGRGAIVDPTHELAQEPPAPAPPEGPTPSAL